MCGSNALPALAVNRRRREDMMPKPGANIGLNPGKVLKLPTGLALNEINTERL